jgi:hypothetical protein
MAAAHEPLYSVPKANIICYCLPKEQGGQSQCFLFQGYLLDLTMLFAEPHRVWSTTLKKARAGNLQECRL